MQIIYKMQDTYYYIVQYIGLFAHMEYMTVFYKETSSLRIPEMLILMSKSIRTSVSPS